MKTRTSAGRSSWQEQLEQKAETLNLRIPDLWHTPIPSILALVRVLSNPWQLVLLTLPGLMAQVREDTNLGSQVFE